MTEYIEESPSESNTFSFKVGDIIKAGEVIPEGTLYIYVPRPRTLHDDDVMIGLYVGRGDVEQKDILVVGVPMREQEDNNQAR